MIDTNGLPEAAIEGITACKNGADFTTHIGSDDDVRLWKIGWTMQHFDGVRLRREEWIYHRYEYTALATHVLAVASLNLECRQWKVYCDAVPGEMHESEWQAVAAHGCEVSEAMGKALFPTFAEHFEWRR